MKTIIKCDKDDYDVLAGIWERSVRASHFFLSEEVINEIREALIPNYFPNVDLYAVSADGGQLAGFIGLSERKLRCCLLTAIVAGLATDQCCLNLPDAREL